MSSRQSAPAVPGHRRNLLLGRPAKVEAIGRNLIPLRKMRLSPFSRDVTLRKDMPLVAAAALILGWAVVRAAVQSITMDEADTYFWFVSNGHVFDSFSNNHVLNSLLMWAATHAFGLLTILAMHWLAFRFAGLPLPLGRTGIFLVSMSTLLITVIASAPATSGFARFVRLGLNTALIATACYFLFCLRLDYFREYQWDADSKQIYALLARLQHRKGIQRVCVTGLRISSLNYYRLRSGKETFPEFTRDASDADVYVLSAFDDRAILKRKNLKIIYRGNYSDAVVAIPVPSGLLHCDATGCP